MLYAGLPEREQLGPSAFLGPVVGLHLQPEALEAHEHSTNLFPGITFAVDDESWNTACSSSSHSIWPRTTQPSADFAICGPAGVCGYAQNVPRSLPSYSLL